MEDLLNTAPCGFLSFADDGTIADVNDTLLGILEYDRSDLIGSSIETILTTASRIFFQTHFFPLIKLHGRAEEIFISLRSKEGQDVPMLTNAARRERGGTIRNECIFMTVRQRRRYEDEILQAKQAAEEALQSNEELVRAKAKLEHQAHLLDRQVSRLTRNSRETARLSSILAHELREPIRKVALLVDLIDRENAESLTPSSKQWIGTIQAACTRMYELVTALQQFVALDVPNERPEQVSLDQVLHTALDRVQESTGVHDITFDAQPLPVIEGHRRQLLLLFRHLIDNAVKFRKGDVPLTISVSSVILPYNNFRSTEGRYQYVDFVRIVFSDNGIGFDQTYRDYVFELLRKANRGTPGLGLGLPICRKIVENHNGSITVDAEPGNGTTVTILLPVSQHDEHVGDID